MKKYLSSYWLRSAFYTFLQRFSLTFFGFINFIFLTRTLTPTQLGTYALFLTITGIFEMAKSSLLKNAHIKYVSSSDSPDEKAEIASSSFVINATLTLFFILLIAFFSNWLGRWFNIGKEMSTMLVYFIPGMVFMVFFTHLEAIQQSHLDFRGGFAGHLVRQVFFFLVIFYHFISKQGLGLTSLAIYQSVSIGLGAIVLYIFSRKYFLNKFNSSWLWIKKIIGYGGYIFGSGMTANIYTNLDQLMIGKFMNAGSVAYYNVASRINGLVDIPSYAASEIIFPKSSRASVDEGNEKVKYLFEKMVGVLMAFTVPAAIFIIIFSKQITTIISGHQYAAAAPILQLYMLTGLLRPVQNQAANLMNSIGKAKLVFIMNTATLGSMLIINYIFLKYLGFYGAAIGTLIATMLSFIAWYFIMRKEVDLDLAKVYYYSRDTYKSVYTQVMKIIFKKKSTVS